MLCTHHKISSYVIYDISYITSASFKTIVFYFFKSRSTQYVYGQFSEVNLNRLSAKTLLQNVFKNDPLENGVSHKLVVGLDYS